MATKRKAAKRRAKTAKASAARPAKAAARPQKRTAPRWRWRRARARASRQRVAAMSTRRRSRVCETDEDLQAMLDRAARHRRAHRGAARRAAVAPGGELQRGRVRVAAAATTSPTLREVAHDPDPELRQRVLGILAREKDGFAQKRLLEGLREPDKALVPPEKALQLLSYDMHADAYAVGAGDRPRSRPTRPRSARRCACSPRTPRPRRCSRRSSATRRSCARYRQIAASALHALKPDMLQARAREIVLDTGELSARSRRRASPRSPSSATRPPWPATNPCSSGCRG